MRIAFVSDIHSNYEAFSTALADAYSRKVQAIYCLGDIVGYGAEPNECIDLAREHCCVTIMGNHDAAALIPSMAAEFNENAQRAIAWTTTQLVPESRDFLARATLEYHKDEWTAFHSTPYMPEMWYYITSLEDALKNFTYFTSPFCFIGHTHIPGVIAHNPFANDITIHRESRFYYGDLPDSRFIVNVGSVGQPRDRDPRSSYVILDNETKMVEFHRVAYDIARTQARMSAVHLPPFLISRLSEGR